jgi:oligopeptide transport system substrate-binding protein
MRSGMIFSKKAILPIFFALSMLLVACGGGSGSGGAATGPTQATKAPENKQVLVRPYEGLSDLSTLDPALDTDLYSEQAIYMIFNGLVQLDDKGNVIPVLAQSYKVSTDGLTYTFTLRDGLKFSDGTPLTSDDVVYSIDRAIQPATKSAYGYYYLNRIKDSDKLNAGKIKTLIGDSLLAPDPKTVVIVINQPAAYFLYALSDPLSWTIEKSYLQKYGNNFTDHLGTGGGSGPWIVSKYNHGQEIDFTPNQYYFGKKPQLREVARPFYKQSDTSFRAYQVGQLDRATVPTANLAAAKSLPDSQFHQDPALAISYWTMNYLVKPFDNIKVRQAFDLALNKDAIANDVYKGTVIATNHIVPQGQPGYDANLKGPDGTTSTAGNPTLARKLFDEGLQEDGLTRATLPPIIFTGSSVGQADIRNEFAAEQQMWQKALGITVKIDDIDFNKLNADTTGTQNNTNLMAWGLGWIADYPDPQDWTSIQFGKGAGNNDSNYGQNNSSDAAQQQATQQLLAQADANSNPTERMQQYNQAEQQLVNDVAWLPTYQQSILYVQKPCVAGWVDNALDLVPSDDWGNMYISTATPCADTSAYQ